MCRQIQKLAKNDSPVFLAIIPTNESPNKREDKRGKRSLNREAKFAAAHGITEGQKRQISKQTGPKKDIISVKEREQKALDSIPIKYRKDLELLIK